MQSTTAGAAPSPAQQSLTALFDPGSFRELEAFVDAGVATCYGSLNGLPVYAFAQEPTRCSGGFGRAEAEKIHRLYQMAAKTGSPVVGFYNSSGGFLDEGAGLLEAYCQLLGCAASISGVVPQIAVVTGVCAGAAALAACSADIVILTPKAELLLTPPAAAGNENVETALKAGVAQLLAEDEAQALAMVRTLLELLPANNLCAVPPVNYTHGDVSLLAGAPQDISCLAAGLADIGSLLELGAKASSCLQTYLCRIAGNTVGLAVTTGQEICAGGAAKLARLVQLCDAFQLPILTAIYTTGLRHTAQGEQPRAIQTAVRLAQLYSEATTPKLALFVGQASGAAAVALSQADIRLAWPSAVISPLSPQAAVALLYEDKITPETSRAQVEQEYCQTTASAAAAAAAGFVQRVIRPEDTHAELAAALDLLASKRVNKMPRKRAVLAF